MNAKEKATKLVGKFLPYVDSDNGSVHDPGYSIEEQTKNAKQCALIAVEEIKQAIKTTTDHCELRKIDLIEVKSDINYWQQVKQEIEKL